MSSAEQHAMVEVATAALELQLPNGVLVDLSNPAEVAQAYLDLQNLERLIREARGRLAEALDQEALRLGRRSFRSGGYAIKLSVDKDTVYRDLDVLRAELRAAGVPEERLVQLVRQVVEEKVDGNVARQLCTNPEYRRIIEANRVTTQRPPKPTVERVL